MSSGRAPQHDDRLLELLADRALDWLAPEDARELNRLIAVAGPTFDVECLERAAAATAVALTPAEPLPDAVRALLGGAVDAWAAQGAPPPVARDRTQDGPAGAGRGVSGRGRGPSPFGVAGWFVGAAAVLFALMLWATRPRGGVPYAPAPLDAQRQTLIDTAPDLVRVAWMSMGDAAAPGAVEGEIVWSDKLNRGFMTFKGLAANNPGKEQYQLWIFDEGRDERYPVDGGVFDIPVADEVTIIEVDPRLHVDHASGFAVTVERPGGVVVSRRERTAVVAEPR